MRRNDSLNYYISITNATKKLKRMENQQPTPGKYALTYGLILGGISLVFNIMLYVMDMHYQRDWTVGIIGLLIMVAILSIAIFQFKKANAGILLLGQAIKIGVGGALIAAIIGVIYQYALANFIDPDFVTKVLEVQSNKAVEAGKINSEQAAQQMEMGRKFFWIGYPAALLVSMFFGFIISLIAGLIMKKSPSDY